MFEKVIYTNKTDKLFKLTWIYYQRLLTKDEKNGDKIEIRALWKKKG